jgi:hypothetical protein
VTKYRGFEMVWGRATTSGFGTVATITQVREVTPGFGSERALFDASAYGDQWNDYLSLQQDGVDISMTVLWDPADAVHLLLKSDQETPANNTWVKATHTPSGKAYNITTVPHGLSWAAARDGGVEATFMLKIVNPGVVMV